MTHQLLLDAYRSASSIKGTSGTYAGTYAIQREAFRVSLLPLGCICAGWFPVRRDGQYAWKVT